MYGIFSYIWVIFRANVGKYSIHGAYGYDDLIIRDERLLNQNALLPFRAMHIDVTWSTSHKNPYKTRLVSSRMILGNV